MEEVSQVPEQQDPFAGMPPEIQDDVDGLIWLGYLEDNFEYCGHNFVIRTLRGDEELLAGLVSKEYVESIGQAKAHAWSTVALALVSVDGDEAFCPAAGPDKRAYARARFQYCTQNWFWPVGHNLYNRYVGLLERQNEAIRQVEDFSHGSLQSFSPSASSLTDRASSEGQEEPLEDIRQYLDPEDGSTDSNSDS